ncbi:hypothetical protein [Escherichia fergusonii]|uniref:hypothetical protein n=1 Tax=Escherichia fergusonii TaxID=564 RepID=UPI0015F66718|nr:hypothetical protein [Escherichia fergusonii]MBA5614512.1 hypothetical protein [Escherichia fergusonii]MBA5661612.1 hypothetical protein [Escherichia fergusonii]MBA8156754.1 hypothetical protein [Escherichia fergusonii]MBA8170912.1 hypothetical protein [Escherichia fergusonii]MBA8184484.1 hypothetical protein [Escherichia fergusonii]
MEVIDKETDSIQAMSDSAVLSYVYGQSGFSIDLNKCLVRLFNTASGINAAYDYNQIREINYTLLNTDFGDAEICILTSGSNNALWKFTVKSEDSERICERWINIFDEQIFNSI